MCNKCNFSYKFEHSRCNMSATWKNIHDVLGRTKQINLNHKYRKEDYIYENPDDIVKVISMIDYNLLALIQYVLVHCT